MVMVLVLRVARSMVSENVRLTTPVPISKLVNSLMLGALESLTNSPRGVSIVGSKESPTVSNTAPSSRSMKQFVPEKQRLNSPSSLKSELDIATSTTLVSPVVGMLVRNMNRVVRLES